MKKSGVFEYKMRRVTARSSPATNLLVEYDVVDKRTEAKIGEIQDAGKIEYRGQILPGEVTRVMRHYCKLGYV